MTLNFPVIERRFADAMRANRRPTALMMTPTDWNPDLMPERAMVELKYDGIHLGFRDQAAFTREGVDFRCASHLLPGLGAIDDMLLTAFGSRCALFGEYVHFEGFEGALADFQRGTGTGAVILFDAVPIAAYEGREPSLSLFDRRQRLLTCVKAVPAAQLGACAVGKVALFFGDNRDNIEVAAGAAWEEGHEGIVVKDADSPYVRGASPYWQRIKRRVTVDVRVLDVVRRQRSGKLQAIIVDAGDGKRCSVGVGFSAAERDDPDAFRGRLVEIRHLGITGGGLFRSPSFIRFRDDKESPRAR